MPHLLRPRALLVLVLVAVVAAGCSGSGDDTAAASDGGARKVTVAGDSISVGLGAALREAVGDGTEVKVIGEPGTGLARADSFDWNARLDELARDFPPDVLVFSLGSNDAQDLVDAGGDVAVTMADDDAWDEEYSRRLAAAFDAFEDTGTTVVWVGHVRTEEDRVGLTNRGVHRLAAEVAADRDWVVVTDLAEMLGSGEDVAEDCLTDDGLHLTVDCLERAASSLAATPPIG